MPAAVQVRVPATVANLGPGFDAVGVAVKLHLEIDIEPRRQGIEITLEGEGADELPRDDSNLVIRSMNAFFDRIGRRPGGFAVHVRNPIPIGVGLGSSAAATVGGFFAARAVTGGGAPQAEMVQLAVELEGHPDNVVPALLGGLVVCYRPNGAGDVKYFRVDPSDRLVPIMIVPRRGFPTRAARAALPKEVAFRDAQYTASRAGLLIAALTEGAGADVLVDAMSDRLHEPHRLKLMPESEEVYRDLQAAGLPVALAGAGPALLVVCPRPEAGVRADQVRRICRNRPAGWRVFVSEWEHSGAQGGE